MRIVAIIPARMASTRFPGKPLLEIEGLPMVEHVRRRALLCRGFSDVVVATCDADIARVVERHGGRVIMTSDKHRVATERIIEAFVSLDCTHVVNVQGDEVLVLPSDLDAMVAAVRSAPEGEVWNAVAPLTQKGELEDRSIVKCLLSASGKFLTCSRLFPHLPVESVRWVIGLLAYSRKLLDNFQKLPVTPLETAESIEQMRFLENDIPVASVPMEKAYPGINEPREVAVVEKYLREDGEQREILEKILG